MSSSDLSSGQAFEFRSKKITLSMLNSLNLRKKKKKIIYSFYHVSSPTYD